MKRIHLIVALAVCLAAGMAYGGELQTPTLSIDPNGDLFCVATNVHKNVLDVHVEVIDRLGNVVSDGDIPLTPGHSLGVNYVNPSGSAELFRCLFSFQGQKQRVLGVACGRPPTAGTNGCEAALTAE